uniref:Uncharacterized protein MANES_13G150700 n=1 Tax=Rhizophora mucronata TaxID=61149 RepID=A0A2P2KLF8_RHIMU
MLGLPDELWRHILETGIRKSQFTYRDLCCISIVCRRLHRLSGEDTIWSTLLSSDFPPAPLQLQNPRSKGGNSPRSPSAKSSYRIRFEREREKAATAHRRALLRKESQIMEHQRRIREIENQLGLETDKKRAAAAELSSLAKARQATVALNVWQPEVVRSRQKQIVEQCAVPIEFRVRSLEMEVKLCKQQISGCNKAYMDEIKRLQTAKEELAFLKYHPLQDYGLGSCGDDESMKKRKKLKRCINFPEKQGSSPWAPTWDQLEG